MAILSSLQSPADAANAVLVRLGKHERVGSLFDGSAAGKRFLDIFGQTRDAVLREHDWDFAQRDIVLTLLKTAPVTGYLLPGSWNPVTNPPIPWFYEYQFPTDCLKVRTLKSSTPTMAINFDPKTVLYTEANDNNFTPAQKVILTNMQNAAAVYTGRVTDPSTWDASFGEALIAALARRFAGDPELMKIEGQDEGSSLAVASQERG